VSRSGVGNLSYVSLHSDTDWTRVTRYVAGDLTPDERAAAERWIDAEPGRRATCDALRQRWEAIQPVSLDWDSHAMWNGLQEDLDRSAPRPSTARRRVAPSARRPWILAVAATAVAVAGVFVIRTASPDVSGRTAPSVVRDFATQRGQRATVDLPDGSSVVLGPATRLRYAVSARGEREITLQGEGYFTVTPDPARPFLVRSGALVTRVLGTTFAVQAYDAATTQVVVTEGKVAVNTLRSAQSAVLLAGDVARTDAKDTLAVTRNTTVGALLQWTVGRLTFDEIPFADMIPVLERWYDVEIRVTDPALAQQPVTIVLDVAAKDRAFTSLAAVLGARVSQNGRHITFTSSHP
jgi:transmembrane sensor